MDDVLQIANSSALAVALMLAVTNTAIVEYIKRPVEQWVPEQYKPLFLYVSLVTGFVIGWFAGVNLFAPLVDSAVLGRVLTGILIGGGASLIHDILSSVTGALSKDV